MKNSLRSIAGFMLVLFLVISCSEDKHEPIDKDQSVPGQVTNVQYTPLTGGARITYDLPPDQNLLCISAVVNVSQGRNYSYTSSSHINEIVVLGLPTANEQEILLYSVSTSGVKSEPVSFKITPLTPPYQAVSETLEMIATWGGVSVSCVNESGADLAYLLGYIDDKGGFVDYASFQSKEITDVFSFHGLENKETRFGVYIRDRWDNYSDTIYATLTPLREVMIDKSQFKIMQLDGDGKYGTYGNEQPENIWNGVWGTDWNDNYGDWKHFLVKEDVADSQEYATFTMDIGVLTQLSRVIVNHYYRYDNHMPRKYEMYGYVGYEDDLLPSSEGDWSNWTLLHTFENSKESGLPGAGDATLKDIENWLKGDQVVFVPEPSPPVRYIRFKSLGSWNGLNNISIAEITYYGDPKE